MSTWSRDAGGYYFHKDNRDVFVRSTHSVGYCKWEVVRRHLPALRFETLSRHKTLADAKRSAEESFVRFR